jgi:hypothetical protein
MEELQTVLEMSDEEGGHLKPIMIRRESRQCEKPIMNRKFTLVEFPSVNDENQEIRKSTLFKRISRTQIPIDLIQTYLPDYEP